jgi:hypothetical protein
MSQPTLVSLRDVRAGRLKAFLERCGVDLVGLIDLMFGVALGPVDSELVVMGQPGALRVVCFGAQLSAASARVPFQTRSLFEKRALFVKGKVPSSE